MIWLNLSYYLIDFNYAVNFSYKPEASQKSNGSLIIKKIGSLISIYLTFIKIKSIKSFWVDSSSNGLKEKLILTNRLLTGKQEKEECHN